MEIIDARFGGQDHKCSGSWNYQGLNTTGHEIYDCDSGKHTIIGPSLDAGHECTDECERAQADIGQLEAEL